MVVLMSLLVTHPDHRIGHPCCDALGSHFYLRAISAWDSPQKKIFKGKPSQESSSWVLMNMLLMHPDPPNRSGHPCCDVSDANISAWMLTFGILLRKFEDSPSQESRRVLNELMMHPYYRIGHSRFDVSDSSISAWVSHRASSVLPKYGSQRHLWHWRLWQETSPKIQRSWESLASLQ